MVRKQTGMVIVALVWLAAACSADQVKVRNGDQLTGDVVHIGGGRVVLKTDYAGDIVLPAGDVTGLDMGGKYLYLDLESGQRLQCTVKGVSPGTLLVETVDGKSQTVAMSDIMGSQDAPLTKSLVSGALTTPWHGRFVWGYGLTSGTSSSHDWNFGAHPSVGLGRYRFFSNLTVEQGETEGRKSVDRESLEVGLATSPGASGIYYELKARGERDDLRMIDLRRTFSATVGKQFLRKYNHRLSAWIGAASDKVEYDPSLGYATDSELSLNAGLNYRRPFLGTSSLELELEYYPTMNDFGNYWGTGELSLIQPLTSLLEFRVSAYDTYYGVVPPGRTRNDLRVRSSFGYRF